MDTPRPPMETAIPEFCSAFHNFFGSLELDDLLADCTGT